MGLVQGSTKRVPAAFIPSGLSSKPAGQSSSSPMPAVAWTLPGPDRGGEKSVKRSEGTWQHPLSLARWAQVQQVFRPLICYECGCSADSM